MIEMRPKHDHVTEIIAALDAAIQQNAEFWAAWDHEFWDKLLDFEQ